MGTALALSILFVKPTLSTLVFYSVSIVVIWLATKFSHLVLEHPRLKNRVVEPEIKYIFLLLLVFIYFAKRGEGQAVLPAFVLGLMMSKHFREDAETRVVSVRLRTVAYAIITPMFFIVGGLRISLPLILSAFGIFTALFAVKISGKFLGVFFLARRYVPKGSMYTTLPDEHRADIRHHSERLRAHLRLHRPGPVFRAHRRRACERGRPHVRRPEMVHARARGGYRGGRGRFRLTVGGI